MATSTDGRLFAWNATAGEIQEYNPVGDTWSFVQAIPPVGADYGNLEYEKDSEGKKLRQRRVGVHGQQ